MSDDGTTVEDRIAELEKLIDDLESEVRPATNRDIPLLKGTIRAMADESIDSVDGFPRAGRRFSEEVTAMVQRVSDLEARVAQLGEVDDTQSRADRSRWQGAQRWLRHGDGYF